MDYFLLTAISHNLSTDTLSALQQLYPQLTLRIWPIQPNIKARAPLTVRCLSAIDVLSLNQSGSLQKSILLFWFPADFTIKYGLYWSHNIESSWRLLALIEIETLSFPYILLICTDYVENIVEAILSRYCQEHFKKRPISFEIFYI